MALSFSAAMVASLVLGEWGAPPERVLKAGDVGVVHLVKSDTTKVVLEVHFPRAWRDTDVKPGKKIELTQQVVIADAQGVLFTGKITGVAGKSMCENDGGTWVEPVARLELELAKLGHPLGKPIGSDRVVAVVGLGTAPRAALTTAADANTLMRVDLDRDGTPDAELRTEKSEAGCGRTMKEPELRILGDKQNVKARCCGP